MQSLLSPVSRSTTALPSPPCVASAVSEAALPSLQPRPFLRWDSARDSHSSLSSFKLLRGYAILSNGSRNSVASAPATSYDTSSVDDPEKAKLAQVSKRLQTLSRHFKRLGSFGFWAQLVCTISAAIILSFSTLVGGQSTAVVTFYATAAGIAAAFVSVFWSFGYVRLSDKLKKSANDPSKAPLRSDVVRSIKNGIIVNVLGLGASILGMQATVGALVGKALTTSTNPFQGVGPGVSPVLALDVFLVQASANAVLSHFLGISCNLELLRSVTTPESVQAPKMA